MSNRRITSLAAAVLLLLAGCQPTQQPPPGEQSPSAAAPTTELSVTEGSAESAGPEKAANPTKRTVLKNLFYIPELFAAGCAAPAEYVLEGDLRAGMVPHHLLASDMISGFFALAARQEKPYDAVLLVSPSHFPENCGSMAVTATAAWDTHLGGVEPDRQLIDALLASAILDAEDNPAAVEQDHGVAGLVPYVKKYLPGVPLAVCLLSNKLPVERLDVFQDLLEAEAAKRNVLVVASADCSHYLTPAEAARYDEQTIQAIQSGNRAWLLSFDDKNIDSPQAVTSFLRAAQAAQAEVVLLGHSSSDKKLPHAPTNPIYEEGITTYLLWAAAN